MTISTKSMILRRFLIFLTLYNFTVDSHFLFADLEDETATVRVIFAEPGAESKAEFLGGRFSKMTQITRNVDPNTPEELNFLSSDISLKEIVNFEGDYFKGTFEPGAPTYVTGFLDFGPYGKEENPPDLRYTVSAQLFSSNMNVKGDHDDDDTDTEFESFFQKLNNRKFLEGDIHMEGDFRIVMNNLGQRVEGKESYEVTAFLPNSYQEDVSVQACLYHATSGEMLDCQVGSFSQANTNATSISLHPSQTLKECTGYYTLANTTLINAEDDKISFWSSTYVMTPGENCEEKRYTTGHISLSDSLPSVSLAFFMAAALGYLSGCILYRVSGGSKQTHHIPISTEDGYRDKPQLELY